MNQRDDEAAAYWSSLRAARDPAAEQVIPAMTEDNFEAALRTRIPDDYMWQRMRDSQQWSEFELSSVWEPQYIRDKYATGEAPTAAVMRNVSGMQTLHFLDEAGVETSRTRQVTVSILMVCAPARPLMRVQPAELVFVLPRLRSGHTLEVSARSYTQRNEMGHRDRGHISR